MLIHIWLWTRGFGRGPMASPYQEWVLVPGISTNVAFLVKHWAGRQGGFCLAWCWWYGGVCKHEINFVVNIEVIWREKLLPLSVIRCIWPADTSFLKAKRCQKREVPTIQRAILWQMVFEVSLRSKRNCDNQLSPKCLHFLWSNPSHKLPVPLSKSYWKQWKDSHWFNPSYGHALGEEGFVILLIAISTIMYTVISISKFRLYRLCGKYLWITKMLNFLYKFAVRVLRTTWPSLAYLVIYSK